GSNPLCSCAESAKSKTFGHRRTVVRLAKPQVGDPLKRDAKGGLRASSETGRCRPKAQLSPPGLMPRFLWAAALVAPLLAFPIAHAQELTGTLKRSRTPKRSPYGYRATSIPFSFVNKVGECPPALGPKGSAIESRPEPRTENTQGILMYALGS